MTRVLIITSNFPRWEGDPHSPWLLALMARLQARGLSFQVLAPAFRGMRSHEIDGIPVHRFRYAPARWETLTHEDGAPNKIRSRPAYLLLLPFYVLAGLWATWRLTGQTSFDIIHVHWPVPQGLFGLLARWRSRGRLVATFYGSGLVMAQHWPGLRQFVRFFVRRSHAITVISPFTARLLSAITNTTPHVIPYGVVLPPPQVWPRTQGMILVVGRLIPRKGHMVLLRAMRLLCDLPQVHLMIVGEGQERARLEEAIRRWGLEPCVTLTGRISDADLQQMYRRCHVFVLPAIIDERGDTEMLGMVVPEAMRYAKPVVVTAVGGLVDFVGSGASGLVVAPADPQALAAALRQVLLDDALAARLGAGGYELVRTQFSWPRVEQALLEVYGVQV